VRLSTPVRFPLFSSYSPYLQVFIHFLYGMSMESEKKKKRKNLLRKFFCAHKGLNPKLEIFVLQEPKSIQNFCSDFKLFFSGA